MEKKSGALWYSIPDKEDEIWARTDLTREEKESAKLRLEVEAAQNPNPEIEEQRRIIDRHKQLAGFYKQRYRYLPEFEQAYRIFEEEGAGDNPIQIADTMASLEMYKEASKHDPEELHQYFESRLNGRKAIIPTLTNNS